MKMDFTLNLTQEQKLIMTQQMQLSVKLLQMSSFELQEYMEKEFQENPVLEAKYEENSETDKFKDRIDYKELIKYFEFDNYGSQSYGNYDEDEVSPFNFISNSKSLKEYLHEQIGELNENDYLKSICDYIIENIDNRGYLDTTLEEICKEIKCNKELGEKALSIVQSLEPDGIGARDIKECLNIQLRKKGEEDDLIYKIIEEHIENLADNKYNIIAKDLNISLKDVQHYGDIIKSLEPKPSRGFFTGDEVKYVIPDAYIRKIDGVYHIIMNDSLLPKLSINSIYKDIINNEKDKFAVEYVKDRINSAMFLIKSVEHRKSTIYKVLEKILELQKDYFEYGEEYLKPMTLKEIADNLGMHESTISRAIRDKYIYTSRGTIRIKDLFTIGYNNEQGEDISVKNIKNQIKKLVEEEDKTKPLSDQAICDELNNMNMNISRRTVAKYREELGIKSSSKRKRF